MTKREKAMNIIQDEMDETTKDMNEAKTKKDKLTYKAIWFALSHVQGRIATELF